MSAPAIKGKVYLMGAGPGDPDLLTVKALRVLRAAEVVLHDDLVSSKILDLIPASTQVRNVGKRCGQAAISQEKIHSLLISAAREGRQVVRLKGGDPLLFGRVGEEMEALSLAGIDFEVVPGVTSAMGAAAAAKIPPAVWDDVISQDATHVVYMPGADYSEIAARLSAGGLNGRTPCLVVANATQAEQQIHRTTLHQLALEPHLPAPALLIIGDVARPLPHFEEGEKASPRAASKPHEEVLHLADRPIRA